MASDARPRRGPQQRRTRRDVLRRGGGRESILWGCLLSFFNLGAWGVTYGYTPELYPTWLRGRGTGLAVCRLMAGGGGGFTSVFVMFAAVLAPGSLSVALLGEETLGLTLEEISV